MNVTEYVAFAPNQAAAFQFQPTLDGNVYLAIVTWGLWDQRFYLGVYAQDGTVIFNEPVVGSPTGLPVQALDWENGAVTVTTLFPHNYKIGSLHTLTVAGCAPDAYNGQNLQCLATGPDTLQFSLAADPGDPTAFGSISYNIDLVGAYFDTTTLIFRDQTQNFEITNPVAAAEAAATIAGQSLQGLFTLDQSQLGGTDVLGA